MAGFLYFLPGVEKKPTNAAAIPAEYGLATIFDGEPFDGAAYIHGGPEGKSGVIVPMSGVAPLYKPDDQVWEKFCGSETPECWIGFNRRARPGPGDLWRSHVISGELVELADGNQWCVPVIHSGSIEDVALPQTYRVNGRGPYLEVSPEYDDVVRMSEDLFSFIYEDGEDIRSGNRKRFPWTPMQTLNNCVRYLSINYRVRPQEVSAIGILNTDNQFSILLAAIGKLTQERELEAQKKTVTR